MLSTYKLKGCTRCGGDLFLEKDIEDSYIFCLQCGAVFLNREIPVFKKTRERRSLAVPRVRV